MVDEGDDLLMEGGGAVDGYAARVLVLRVENEGRKEQGK